MELSYQVGLDLATSVSIITAAWAFIKNQKQENSRLRNQQTVDNLTGTLTFVIDKIEALQVIDHKMRSEVSNQTSEEEFGKNANRILDKFWLDTIFLLESVQRKLKLHIEILYPVYKSEDAPDSVKSLLLNVDELLNEVKNGDRSGLLNVQEKIEHMLHNTITCLANSLVELRTANR